MGEQTEMAIRVLDHCAASREGWAAGPVSGLSIGYDPTPEEIEERRNIFRAGAARLRWISGAIGRGAPLDTAAASLAHQDCSAAGEWLASLVAGEHLYWDGQVFRPRV